MIVKGRSFVINSQLTSFMQAADIFDRHKVAYQDLALCYECDDSLDEYNPDVLLQVFASEEFGNDLIILLNKENKPLYINNNVQVISDGKKWSKLIEVLKKICPDTEFEHDQYYKNIKVK